MAVFARWFGKSPPSEIDQASRALDAAETLAGRGDVRGAVARAAAIDRRLRSAELERRIVTWRASAFATLDRAEQRADWPPDFADPFPGLDGVPKIEAAELTVEMLGGAIQHHGCLWVRGLAPPAAAERMRQGIDRAFAGRDACHAGAPPDQTGPWYARTGMSDWLAGAREWVEGAGGVWTAESPRMLGELIELFEQRGVLGVIGQLLGERPALSIGKSTLRRVEGIAHSDWHQDGAFLGADIRTVNVWLTLSPCGEDAAGLELVGRRIPEIVQTGTEGANFPWSVGPGLVAAMAAGGAPVLSPVFEAGDALLFDQLMLHRTAIGPNFVKPRWAIESWLFAPSTFPMEQEPLVI